MKITYEHKRMHKKKNSGNLCVSIAMIIISLLLSIATGNKNNNTSVIAEAFSIVGEGVLENSSIDETISDVFECITVYSENDPVKVFNNNAEKFKN